jgi:cytosine/adenosine deaminase-related metal-dependent hydrolase
MGRTLLKGGCVLSLDRKVGNFRVADVLIEDDRIADVGPDLRSRGAEIVDASDTIVMPGFVDSHRHTSESLFRGIGDAEPGDTGVFSADDLYTATLIGLLGAAEAGVTTVVDWCDLTSEDHLSSTIQAHDEARLRTVLVQSGTDPRAWRRDDKPLLTALAVGPVSIEDWPRARDLGLHIHAHAGVGTEAGRPEVLTSVLGGDVTLIHCTGFEDLDLDQVGSAGASIVLTPSADMAGGVEPLQVQKLVDRGIRPGLGIDTERRGPGDLFAQMRAAISLQHATLFDLKLAGKAGIPKLLTTREVIRYATIDGARAVGLGELTGSLTPGKQADVTVLRADRPNIYPINDPIGAVVWGMDTSNVDWVFVAGVAVKREGRLVADLGRVAEMAADARERVLSTGDAPIDVAAGVEGGR